MNGDAEGGRDYPTPRSVPFSYALSAFHVIVKASSLEVLGQPLATDFFHDRYGRLGKHAAAVIDNNLEAVGAGGAPLQLPSAVLARDSRVVYGKG